MVPCWRGAGVPAVAAVLMLVAAVVSGCVLLSPAARPVVVTIGVDVAFSGRYAEHDRVVLQGLQLRVEQVNQRGVLPGYELRLLVVDNGSDVDTSVANVAELAADPAVAVVVAGSCGPCVAAAAPLLDEAGLAMVTVAAGEQVASPVAERRHVFQLAPRAGDAGQVLAGEAARLGLGMVALVAADDQVGREVRREWRAAAEASGLGLPVVEVLDPEADRAQVQQLAQRLATWSPPPGFDEFGLPLPVAGLDAVVVWTPPRQAVDLAVELRGHGFDGPLLLAPAAAGSLFMSDDPAGREALAGARLVFTETLVADQVVAATPARTARQRWWRDYVAGYGGYEAYASLAGDAVDVVVAAVADGGGAGRGQVRDGIEAVSLDGLSGPIRFGPGNHSGLRPLALTVLVAAGDRWRLPTA